MSRLITRTIWVAAMLLGGFSPTALAQLTQTVYADALQGGWQDWSWGTRDFNNAAPVHGGAKSIKASLKAWEAVSFWHQTFSTGPYASLSFWANGGSGGQRLQIVGVADTVDTGSYTLPFALPANRWTNIVVPLSSFGAASAVNFTRFHLQLRNDGTTADFYVDDVQFLPKSAVVTVEVNAGTVVRRVDPRWLGVNTAIWDAQFDSAATRTALAELGTRILRFPGGSISDEYHWATGRTGTNTWPWATSFTQFANVATNAGAEVFITVNYGTGTPEEAAAWVRHANVTNHLGFKYWEIGNEIHGTWEVDANPLPHHAYTYAVRAASYLELMRAVDPTIKIGVVAAPGEDSYQNGYTDHPVLNPRTGQTKYGWTPVLLSTLKQLGARPDFLIHHHYPEWSNPSNPAGADDDANLLSSAGNWARDAADLRQQLMDYYGADSTNVELVVTENNADSGAQGRQSTSLVNGLYYAESLGRLIQTEFNALVWWDLRNGTDTNGDFGSSLYGWRTYGDLGMINGANTRHPTFYAAKLMQHLVTPGADILSAEANLPQLSAFSSRGTDGLLSLLVINKDRSLNLTSRVAVAGFVPRPAALVRSYGIPQDEAARTNAPLASQDLSTNALAGAASAFTNVFAPYSLTLFTFAPAATPSLEIATTSLATGTVEVAYSQALVASGGVAPYAWSISAGGLPDGLSFSGSDLISGTPTERVVTNLTIQVTDALGATTHQSFILTVEPGVRMIPQLVWVAPADITYGTALDDTQLNAIATVEGINVPGSFAYLPAAGAVLPAGLGQTLAVTFTPTDANHYAPTNASVPINVRKALLTATADSTQRLAGQSNPVFTGTLVGVVNGDPLTATFVSDASEASPAGTYDIQPAIQDPESRLANYEVTLVKGTLTIIPAPLMITTLVLPTGVMGTGYRHQLQAVGGVGTPTWSVISGTPPPGLTLDSGGVLAGTPTTGGTNLFTVQVMDSSNHTASASFTLGITVPEGRELLKNGDFAQGFTSWTTQQFAPALARFAVTGDFDGSPAAKTEVLTNSSVGWHVQVYQENLSLTAGQYYLLSYWAKAARATPMTVSLMRSYGDYATMGYSETVNLDGAWKEFHAYFKPTATDNNLRVCFNGFCHQTNTVWLADVRLTLPKALWIATEQLPAGHTGETYTQTLQADGGVGTRTWAVVAGSRPDGLILRSTGILTGVPTTPGTNTFTVQTKDLAGTTATRDFTVVIAPGVPVLPQLAWPAPAEITYGTALGDTQLSATATVEGANVPGSFAYLPTTGTVLPAGAGQPLTVTFTPANPYLYAPTNGSVAIDVRKAPLTATADSAQRLAGQPNPAFAGSLVGVVNGDPLTVTFLCDANEASPAGTYDILPVLHDPGARLPNYEVTLVAGTLTVQPQPRPILRLGIADRVVTLDIEGAVGQGLEIQTADDLSTGWTTHATLTLQASQLRWTDPQPIVGGARFYRLKVD